MKSMSPAVPIIIGQNGVLIKTVIIQIGPWDMDTNASNPVNHSLDIEKIVGFQAYILNDAKDWLTPISYAEGWTEVDGYIDV